MAILVTGGARSGKSAFAEAYAASLGNKGIYIATAPIFDDEMRQRVHMHRKRRASSAFEWHTLEEPFELAELLSTVGESVVLIDCLTLWLTNWLLRYEEDAGREEKTMAKVDELARIMKQSGGRIIAVTNEVGDGVVPEYPLGRQFRDLAGWMNQRLAAVCDQVFLVTAGIPIELKSIAYTLPGRDGGSS